MPTLEPIQWTGVVLMAIAALMFVPQLWTRLKGLLPSKLPDLLDSEETHLDRMARLAALQSDLEARGYVDEAKTAGTWYPLMREPTQDEGGPR